MRFEKWQALGNDYIVVEREELPFELTAERIRTLCEPHVGVGADGILVLSRLDSDAVVARLEVYNPDGSRAELSGNGAREAILYLRDHGWTDADQFSILTDAGVISPHITGPGSCRVDMGMASLTSRDYPGGPEDGTGSVVADNRRWRFRHINIGNPQCAIAVADKEDLECLDLLTIGPPIEGDQLFPNRTNISWYTELRPASLGRPASVRARIFERGVGETLSSGTGACGAAIAYVLDGGAVGGRVPVRVLLDGGELLVEVEEDLHVYLTGWAHPVFSGCLSDLFIQELLYEPE